MAELRLPSLNKVILAARLTRDPEVRFTPSGTPVASFGVALNRRFKEQSGEWREETTFLNVVAWQRLAETCRDTLHKGSAVVVEGRLQSRSWETDGQRRSTVEIIANRVDCLDRVRREGGAPEEEYVGGTAAAEASSAESAQDVNEDVPF